MTASRFSLNWLTVISLRFAWLVLATCAGAGAAVADPPSSAGPLPGYEVIRLGRGPFNRMDFAIVIDGVKGVMIVDTGASGTLLNADKYGFLLKNGVDRPAKVPATTRMNETSAPVAIAKDVQLGSVHLHSIPFPLAPRRYFYDANIGAQDRQYDGYLGENVLRHYNAVIDCARLGLYLNTDPAHKLNLDHALTQNGWTRIPMSNASFNFSVPCTLGAHTYRLLVDTGAPFTQLDADVLSREQIERREVPVLRGAVLGYNPVVESLVNLDTLTIGDYTATNVHPLSNPALQRALALNKSNPGEARLAGLLGGDILAANGAMVDVGSHNLYLKHTGASAPAKP